MNFGRILGIAVTLLAARRFRYMGGVICGALTACGTMLCAGELGMPLLFLPITGLLSGYLVDRGIGLMTIAFFLINALAQLTVGLQVITFSSIGVFIFRMHCISVAEYICFDRWLITANSSYDSTMQTISTVCSLCQKPFTVFGGHQRNCSPATKTETRTGKRSRLRPHLYRL